MDGVKAEPDSEHVEVLLEQNFQLCLSVFLAKMIQLATRHIVTPTQLAFSSQSGLVTIVTTTRTRKMRENDNAGKKNAALNCSGGKCVNENVPQFPASVVLCRIFHFLHFQSSHNDNKWSMNSEEGRTVPALVTPAAGEAILKPRFRCDALSPADKSAALCCCSLCYLNSLMHFNGPENPKLPLPLGRSGLPPNTWFPRPT